MRKRVTTKKFSRSDGHKKALKKNMLQSLFLHDRITTTLPKAKYLRSFAEKMVTRAKKDTEFNRNHISRSLYDANAVERLFSEIAPRFIERSGGYTRIIKLGPRQGDSAEMAILEFVEPNVKTESANKDKSSVKKDDAEK